MEKLVPHSSSDCHFLSPSSCITVNQPVAVMIWFPNSVIMYKVLEESEINSSLSSGQASNLLWEISLPWESTHPVCIVFNSRTNKKTNKNTQKMPSIPSTPSGSMSYLSLCLFLNQSSHGKLLSVSTLPQYRLLWCIAESDDDSPIGFTDHRKLKGVRTLLINISV